MNVSGKQKNSKAFSLLELAIVMVVIGLLSVGITGGKRLITKAKLTRAKMFTQASPVNGIDNLVLWTETTLNGAIHENLIFEVDSWNDLGPNGYNLTEVPGGFALPTFEKNTVNNISAIKFATGVDSLLYYLNVLNFRPGNGTLFLVMSFDAANATTSTTMILGFAPTMLLHIKNAEQSITTTDSTLALHAYDSLWTYTNDDANILTFTVGNGNQIRGYRNGSLLFSENGAYTLFSGSTYPASIDLAIMQSPSYPVSIYMYELIFFNKVLTTDERQEVEEYLSKKHGIKLS